MLKIGVLGAGHLGEIHTKCINEIPEYKLIDFFDPDEINAKAVSKEFGIWIFYSIEELISEADVDFQNCKTEAACFKNNNKSNINPFLPVLEPANS